MGAIERKRVIATLGKSILESQEETALRGLLGVDHEGMQAYKKLFEFLESKGFSKAQAHQIITHGTNINRPIPLRLEGEKRKSRKGTHRRGSRKASKLFKSKAMMPRDKK